MAILYKTHPKVPEEGRGKLGVPRPSAVLRKTLQDDKLSNERTETLRRREHLRISPPRLNGSQSDRSVLGILQTD